MSEGLKFVLSVKDSGSATVRKFDKDLDKLDKSAKKTGESMGFLSKKSDMVKKATAAISTVLAVQSFARLSKAVLSLGIDFEYTMATVKAVSGATVKEFEAMETIARRLGATTMHSATQAAEGLKFLSMAGFEASQGIKALPGVLNLATATSLDLGSAADIVSNALTAMRLPVEELNRVNDVFVATTTTANTNITMMADSFRYAAPLAAALGIDIEELSAYIGLLGNAGIQGSMAGTQLTMAMSKVSKVIREYGEETIKADGSTKTLVDAIELLNRKSASAERVMELFGDRAARAVLALMGTGSDAVEEYIKKLREMQGVTDKIAEEMESTTTARFFALGSAVKELGLETFQTVKEPVNNILKGWAEYVKDFSDGIKGIKWLLTFDKLPYEREQEKFKNIGQELRDKETRLRNLQAALPGYRAVAESPEPGLFGLRKKQPTQELDTAYRAFQTNKAIVSETIIEIAKLKIETGGLEEELKDVGLNIARMMGNTKDPVTDTKKEIDATTDAVIRLNNAITEPRDMMFGFQKGWKPLITGNLGLGRRSQAELDMNFTPGNYGMPIFPERLQSKSLGFGTAGTLGPLGDHLLGDEENTIEIYERTLARMEESASDFFYTIYSGGIQSWTDLTDMMKDTFARMLADMAAQAIMSPLMNGLGGMFGGGAGAATAGATGTAGAGAAAGGIGMAGGVFALAGMAMLASGSSGSNKSTAKFSRGSATFGALGFGDAGKNSQVRAAINNLSEQTLDLIASVPVEIYSQVSASISGAELSLDVGANSWRGIAKKISERWDKTINKVLLMSMERSISGMSGVDSGFITGRLGDLISGGDTSKAVATFEALGDLLEDLDEVMHPELIGTLAGELDNLNKIYITQIQAARDLGVSTALVFDAAVQRTVTATVGSSPYLTSDSFQSSLSGIGVLKGTRPGLFDTLAQTMLSKPKAGAAGEFGFFGIPGVPTAEEAFGTIEAEIAFYEDLAAKTKLGEKGSTGKDFPQIGPSSEAILSHVLTLKTLLEGYGTAVFDTNEAIRINYDAIQQSIIEVSDKLLDLNVSEAVLQFREGIKNLNEFLGLSDIPSDLLSSASGVRSGLISDFFAPITDIIDRNTMSDVEYQTKQLDTWYKNQFDNITALQEVLTNTEFEKAMADLEKAFKLQSDNIIDNYIDPITNAWENFLGGALLDLAPSQSAEAYQNVYGKLFQSAQGGGAEEWNELFSFIQNEYVPFFKTFTGGNYADIFSTIVKQISPYAPEGVVLTPATIGEGVATGIASLLSETNTATNITVQIGSRELLNIIAEDGPGNTNFVNTIRRIAG